MTSQDCETCPHCRTTPDALSAWQAAEDKYKRALDLCLKPDPQVRQERTDTYTALLRRQECPEKHG